MLNGNPAIFKTRGIPSLLLNRFGFIFVCYNACKKYTMFLQYHEPHFLILLELYRGFYL